MEGNLTFIQDVQDVYATLSELTIIITDVEGNAITKVSGMNSFTKIAFEKWISKEEFQRRIQPLVTTTNPSLFVNDLGVHVIVSPVKVEDTCYYTFAGPVIRAFERDLVKKHIDKNITQELNLMHALELTPELSEHEIKVKIELIQKLTTMIETYLMQQNEQKLNEQRSIFLQEKLEAIPTGGVTTEAFLDELYQLHPAIDFLGLATEKENQQYMIETIYGKNTQGLQDHEFTIGEGFLGHTIATQQFQFWADVRNDPRTHFFKRNALEPRSLFCLPVYGEDCIIGIFFGGSTERKIKATSVIEAFKVYASLLSTIVTTNQIKQNLQNHLMELSTFNEIFRVITTVKDMKRVLYILVDISINITRGPFACIVFKPDINHSKVDIVSRGLSSAEINDYCYDIAVKAFSSPDNEVQQEQTFQRKTSWGTDVLEIPLVYANRVYGVLCVGLHPNNNFDQFKAFLSTLTVAGSISFHLCQNPSAGSLDDRTIELLQDVMRRLNKKEYGVAVQVKNLVEQFTQTLNEGDFTSLVKISGLAGYDFDLIEKYLMDRELLDILEGFQNVMQDRSVERQDSEILGIVYKYVNEDRDADVILEMSNVNEGLRSQFLSFVNRHSIVEMEIILDEGHSVTKQKLKAENAELLLKKELNLSTREIEVLNHILKGFNNREIAARLFISEHTVKNHMTKILQKLAVQDRAQAIAKVYQLGYFPPS